METLNSSAGRRPPWKKGRLTGQKPPLKLREICAIRTRLQLSSNIRELALFSLAIDSKLRARSDAASGSGRLHRRTRGRTDNVYATEDSTTGAVRDHGADPAEYRRMDYGARTETYRLSLSEPATCLASYVDSPVCPHRPPLGRIDRARNPQNPIVLPTRLYAIRRR